MRCAHLRWIALMPLLALATPAHAGGCPSDLEYEIAATINLERILVGLAPLELDVRLVEAAERHAEDMALNGLTGHTGSDGSSPGERMQDAGYEYGLGETVGGRQQTAREVVDDWMASTAHRSILLHSRARHIGTGQATGPSSSSPAWVATVGDDPADAWSPADFCDGSDPAAQPEPDPLPQPDPVPEPDPAPLPACNDGIDNDGDGRIDAYGGPAGERADPQCKSPSDDSEGRPRRHR